MPLALFLSCHPSLGSPPMLIVVTLCATLSSMRAIFVHARPRHFRSMRIEVRAPCLHVDLSIVAFFLSIFEGLPINRDLASS